MSDELLTTEQVLKLLHISRASLYNLRKRKKIAPVYESAGLERPIPKYRRTDVERLLRRDAGA
jgi:predicted DNA-binding transcriptional regulator AlpA